MERIGVGAVAEMFRGKAVAAGGFEKPVAIKRILPHLGQDRRFVQALMAEAKILSQLRHRNIVQIFDVGLGDDGQYFLVMEFVDGMGLDGIQRTLESRRKRLPLDIALHVGAEICEALEHAHTALAPDGKPMRLVHRDVAPSNVLVSRSGETKLTDFGLARRPGEATSHGMRGKFGYVAPEMAAGAAVDLRSDIFSVAAMVYELTLGRRLFSHLPELDAVSAVVECRVPRPRDIDPSLPPELDRILMSALVKEPSRRPASAGKFGAELRSLRYSLDSSAGDPAQELARIVIGVSVASDGPGDDVPSDARNAAGRRRRTPQSTGPEFGRERTVVSLTAIDEFSDDRDGTGLIKARAFLDRFEEEETRLASSPGMGFSGGRWREQQDSFEVPVGQTQQTSTFGGRSDTGEVTFTGTPRAGTDLGDESTKVLSPAQLARRGEPREEASAPRPKLGAPATPPRLPGMAAGKSRPQPVTKPPPVPPPSPPRASGSKPPQPAPPLKIEAVVPARTATPTVQSPPGGPTHPRSTSMPQVAGFGGASRAAADRRRWLIIAAIALAVIGLGIVAALLK